MLRNAILILYFVKSPRTVGPPPTPSLRSVGRFAPSPRTLLRLVVVSPSPSQKKWINAPGC